jgi:mono/diheme cytochrome c family protein
MRTRFKLPIIMITLLLALSACSGGESGERASGTPTGSTGSAAAPATATTAPPAAAGDATKGQQTYVSTCSACHGPEAKGVPGLGKDLTTSEFVTAQSDQQLVEFIKVGRGPTDPGNTTGIAMPPKGGNPALTDAQILDIIAWLRQVHQTK